MHIMKEKEHQSIEWKESWQDEYLKWICGYANAYGGTIYIGTDLKQDLLIGLCAIMMVISVV